MAAYTFSRTLLDQGISYTTYRKQVNDAVAAGGPIGTMEGPKYLEYTSLNNRRMDRLEKTLKINPELEALIRAIEEPLVWVVITEGWCGDAAQNLPFIAALADLNPQIELRLFFRDQHPELMDAYLTNGGKAIPKLIVLRAADLQELGTWGPRPAAAQELMNDWKASGGTDYTVISEAIHGWYAKDRLTTLQEELRSAIPAWLRTATEV